MDWWFLRMGVSNNLSWMTTRSSWSSISSGALWGRKHRAEKKNLVVSQSLLRNQGTKLDSMQWRGNKEKGNFIFFNDNFLSMQFSLKWVTEVDECRTQVSLHTWCSSSGAASLFCCQSLALCRHHWRSVQVLLSLREWIDQWVPGTWS